MAKELDFATNDITNNGNSRDLSIYDIYSLDVSTIPCLNSDKNAKLMIEVVEIIHQLDAVFTKIGCDDKILGGARIPWIADKFEYSLKHCKDINLLNKLKSLYNKYLIMSNKVIEGNLRLVIEIAGEYRENQIVAYEDIIQYGNMGLMRAVEKYNPECGTSFGTYARNWIIKMIKKNIRGIMPAYRVPLHYVYDNYDRMNSYSDLCIELGREPTIFEISEYMGKTLSEVDQMRVVFRDSLSLDETLDLRHGDVETSRGDVVADPNADVFKDVSCNELFEKLKILLPKYLTARQFEMMEKYLGLEGISYNLKEIAVLLDVTPQRVAELKKDAAKRLARIPSFMKVLLD